MGIKLKLQREDWGSCDNSWTYFAITFQRLCWFCSILDLFVLFCCFVGFFLVYFFFFFFGNEDFRLRKTDKWRLGSGPCWPGSSGFWILACASNCRTGLGIVHDKFCQKISESLLIFISCAQKMKRSIKITHLKKMYLAEISAGRKEKNVFLYLYFLKSCMYVYIDVCKLWKYCDPCNSHLSTLDLSMLCSRHRHILFLSICVMHRLFMVLLSPTLQYLFWREICFYTRQIMITKSPYIILLIRKWLIKTSQFKITSLFSWRLSFKKKLPLLHHFQSTFFHPLVPPYFPYTRPFHGCPVGGKKRADKTMSALTPLSLQ